MWITVNGVELYYQKTGQGSPVVLLHGNGESHRIFDVLIRQLATRHTVYAPDSRGQGRSQMGDGISYNQMARDTAAFIRALGLEKPAVYGFSDGGIIGLLLAIHWPGLLSRLAVSGANAMPQGMRARWYWLFRVMDQFAGEAPMLRMMVQEPQITAEQLRSIRLPVLVLAGQCDMVRTQHTCWIAQNIPGSKLCFVPKAGHGDYIVHSPRVYHYIKDFLRP